MRRKAVVCGGRLDGKRVPVEGTFVCHMVIDGDQRLVERYVWQMVGNEIVAIFESERPADE